MSCAHQATHHVRVRISNGSEQIRQRCNECLELFGPAFSRNRFTSAAIAGMPIVEDWSHSRPPCVVCGARGTDEHHWAPRALFDDESYLWPTSWLCPACHTRWHQTVGVPT